MPHNLAGWLFMALWLELVVGAVLSQQPGPAGIVGHLLGLHAGTNLVGWNAG
jgi:hypothetical protein